MISNNSQDSILSALADFNKRFFAILEASSICQKARNLPEEKIVDLAAEIVTDHRLVVGTASTAVPSFVYAVLSIMDQMQEFFKSNADDVRKCLLDYPGRCIYIFQHESFLTEQEIAQYYPFFDIVLFPDTITSHRNSLMYAQNQADLFKYSMAVLMSILGWWCNRDLFLKNPPIAVVVPIGIMINSTSEDNLHEYARSLTLKILSDAAEIDFETRDDLFSKYDELGWSVFSRRPNVLQDVLGEKARDLSTLVQQRLDRHLKMGVDWRQVKPIGVLWSNIFSHVRFCGMLTADAMLFGQDPALPEELWGIYAWLMRYESTKISLALESRICEDVLFSLGVQTTELSWLSQVTFQDIMRFRDENSIASIREAFHLGRMEIKNAKLTDVKSVANRVAAEMSATIDRHTEDLRSLKKRASWKRARRIGSFSLATTFAILGAVFPPLSIPLTGVSILLGGASVVDLVLGEKQQSKELSSLQRRPLGVLSRLRACSQKYTGDHASALE